MRALALLSVALLAAGCAGQSSDGADDVPDPAARVLPDVLAIPAVIPPTLLGTGSGEPNIAVAPDGTLYAVPITTIYRSRDNGATWAALHDRTDGGGDGDLAITPDGRLHWLGLFGDSGPIPYQNSSDGGLTWSGSRDISNETGSDREWIDASPDGVLYASWRDSADDGIIATRTSFDGGLTWTNRSTMAPDAVGGPLTHGPTPGTVYEAYTTFASGTGAADGEVRLARSADHGATWETVPVVTPPQSAAQVGLIGFPTSIFPVAAVDDAGTLYVVYAAEVPYADDLPALPKPAIRTGVYLTVSKDNGDSWSQPLLLSDPGASSLMPFVAAGAEGRIAVVWYQNTVGTPSELVPDLWNVMLWESIDADDAMPESVTVQLSSQPNHVGAVCTSGTGCLVSDRSLLDFFEVAITPAGQPVVAWASSIAGTGVGVSAQGTETWFGTVEGTPLR